MDHGLLGDDAREELPDVPEEAFDDELELGDDSGDRGMEMDGFDDVDDGAGDLQFDDDDPASTGTSTFPTAPAPSQWTVNAGSVSGEEKKGPPPMFDALDEWVHGWLIPVYRRSLDGSNAVFCPEWWRHPEAYLRLDALWKSWEFMRRKPGTGMAVWLRDYCDYHMGVLMREQTGPFKGCTAEAHNAEYSLKPWQLKAMPTPRTIAKLYDRQGVQHARPEGGSPDDVEDTTLRSIQTRQWDGVDQK